MSRRFIAALIVMLALQVGTCSSAFAWANGGPTRNHYGTHDWILDHAIRNAGSSASWINKSAALKASDDPDSYKTDPVLHHFRNTPGARGAAQAVADLYYKAHVAYKSGDTYMASVYVGQMSHYMSDATLPFHTTTAADSAASLHSSYELKVSRITNNSGDKPTWHKKRDPRTVTDVRKTVASAAAYARSKYPGLRKAYGATRSLSNSTVSTATRLCLNRSVNDLTDVIRSIPEGTGLSQTPATFTTWMSMTHPAQGGRIGMLSRSLDAAGRPMVGARIVFAMRAADGTRTITTYTDDNGYASSYQNIGSPPLMKRMPIVISQKSSGQTVVSEEYYMATPALASGGTGVRASVSDYYPSVGETVEARVTVRSSSGKAIAGLPVPFTWNTPEGPQRFTALTDDGGVARCPIDTTALTQGQHVDVAVAVSSGGQNRPVDTGFVPVQ